MNTGRPKGNQKHLDLSARIIIEQHLNNGDSFRSIAIELNKDPSTISKEVRRHSIIRERSTDAFAPIPCANNYDRSKPRTTTRTCSSSTIPTTSEAPTSSPTLKVRSYST